MNEENDIDLVFRVPNTDFDFIAVECGLKGLEKQMHNLPWWAWNVIPNEYSGLMIAYRVLHTIHTRYCEMVERPEYKRPLIDKYHVAP